MSLDLSSMSFDLSNMSWDLSNMSWDLSSMSFDLSNMSWDLSNMSWDLSSMSFDLSNMSLDLSSMSFVDDPLSQSSLWGGMKPFLSALKKLLVGNLKIFILFIHDGSQENFEENFDRDPKHNGGGRPADVASNRNRDPKHNVGVEKRVKRNKSHTKRTVGTFLWDLKSRVWIKRRGDKSHVKGAVENEKKRGGPKRRGRFKGEGWKRRGFKGEGFRFKGDGFQFKGEGFKGDRVSG
ncbi:hypothetical protein TNCV_3615651 [Trichonephila clavipes]|nr:hypothetical protein TNCV_3615651 [Trichonephila clavipes]